DFSESIRGRAGQGRLGKHAGRRRPREEEQVLGRAMKTEQAVASMEIVQSMEAEQSKARRSVGQGECGVGLPSGRPVVPGKVALGRCKAAEQSMSWFARQSTGEGGPVDRWCRVDIGAEQIRRGKRRRELKGGDPYLQAWEANYENDGFAPGCSRSPFKLHGAPIDGLGQR
ncbi:hypothetical protein Dimus_004078, partial [Dionaea muscipula]